MAKCFPEDMAVFCMGRLEAVDGFRNMGNDFAIIPFPKNSGETGTHGYRVVTGPDGGRRRRPWGSYGKDQV